MARGSTKDNEGAMNMEMDPIDFCLKELLKLLRWIVNQVIVL